MNKSQALVVMAIVSLAESAYGESPEAHGNSFDEVRRPAIIRSHEGHEYDFGDGVSSRTKVRAQHTKGVIEILADNYPAGFNGFPPHLHTEHDEIFIVFEGEVELLLGEEVHLLKAGDIVVVPAGVKHGMSTSKNQGAKTYTIASPAFVEVTIEEYEKLTAAQLENKEFVKAFNERHDICEFPQ